MYYNYMLRKIKRIFNKILIKIKKKKIKPYQLWRNVHILEEGIKGEYLWATEINCNDNP